MSTLKAVDSVERVYNETTFSSTDYRKVQPRRGLGKYQNELGHLLPYRPERERDEITDTDSAELNFIERIDQLNCFQYIFFTWMTPVVAAIFGGRLQLHDISHCSPFDSCYYNSMRLRHHWEKEVAHSGLHNARLGCSLYRFVRTRFWIASFAYLLCLVAGYLSSTYFVKRLLEEVEESAHLTIIDGAADLAAVGGNETIPVGWTTRHLRREAIQWTCLLCLCELFRATAYSVMFIGIIRTAARAANALSGMIYEKILSKRASVSGLRIGGRKGSHVETSVVNLFANDIWKIYHMIYMSPLIIGSPIIIFVTIFYTYQLIGTSSFCGLGLFMAIFGLQLGVTKVQTALRRKIMVQTDRRMMLIGEVVKFIRAIKFNGWQEVFREEIGYTRGHESKHIRNYQYLQSLSTSMAILTPMLITIINILVHTVILERDLPISTAFSLVMLNYIAAHGIRSLPNYYREIANGRVALGRIERFLRTDDQASYVRTEGLAQGNSIELAGASFSFSRPSGGKIPESTIRPVIKTSFLLQDINLNVQRGGHVCLYGSIGAGKSALLVSILGQTQNFKGEVRLASTKLAYVAQQPWLQNATIRDNILFGLPFDSGRYYRTLLQCCLSVDIAQLSDGEETVVGENGVQLSGGQKQRIALARAVYADADIYLLDDFFSSLDTRMVRAMFKNILEGTLARKTVVFVTRHLHLLSEDVLVAMITEGRIEQLERHGQLLESDPNYVQLVESSRLGEQAGAGVAGEVVLNEDQELFDGSEEIDKLKYSMDNLRELNGTSKKKQQNGRELAGGKSYESLISLLEQLDGETVELEPRGDEDEVELLPPDVDVEAVIDHNSNEQKSKVFKKEKKNRKKLKQSLRNSIAWHTYADYIKAAGGWVPFVGLLTLFALQAATTIFSAWWLTFWLNEGDGDYNTGNGTTSRHDHFSILNNPHLHLYAFVYFLSFVIVIMTSLTMGFLFANRVLKAANRLHKILLKKVMWAPISFHDTIKIGSIINLFSHHIDVVDNQLPVALDSFLQRALLVVGSVVVIVVTLYWLSIPLILTAVGFGFIFRYYRRATYWLRRAEVSLRRPIGGWIETTLEGKTTIKAFGYDLRFVEQFQQRADRHLAAYFLSESAVRWLSIRVDVMCVLISVVVCIFVLVRLDSIGAAYAGLVITQSMQLSGLLQFVIRLALDLETRLFSVERIKLYIEQLREEASQLIELGAGQKLPRGWPTSGKISFHGVSLRYRRNLPVALRGVNFEVPVASKVAIVGRTGAGKSSITYALFRLVETCAGQIFIDNVDIRAVSLDVLRSRLSIIPQDPVLFHGTVRKNLDPTGKVKEEKLFEVLVKVGLATKIENDFAAGIDETIGDGRDRFSTGEKQLLCLARALLRESRVIVLDEATAAMDDESERRIWRVLDEAFREASVLLIAHRLKTVVHCDQVVVVEAGEVVETGSPDKLMADKKSRFAQMIEKS